MSMDAAFWAERRKLLEADISASHPRNRRRQPVALSKEQKQTVRQEIEQQPVYISAREELG